MADPEAQAEQSAAAVSLAAAACAEPASHNQNEPQSVQNTASPAQQAMLRKRDVDPAGLSYKEAYLAIGYLLQEEENTKRMRTE